ncbi:MAG: hypothetical protein GWN58_62225 [Anaerolineae bacterium]|nr:hypothetical protein [Anaerolineae bacterium]
MVLLVTLFACCCGPAAELVPVYVEKTPVEIVGGHALGRPALSGLRLYGEAYKCRDDPSATCYPTVIKQSVVRIGWDEEFILGERHPREAWIFATPDASHATWFIIVVETSAVYEDLSQEEFAQRLRDLGVPSIELRDAMDLYRQK